MASAELIILVPQYNFSDVNINGRFSSGLNSYVNFIEGSILTIHSQEYKDGTNYNGAINFDNVSLSNVVIVKIQ